MTEIADRLREAREGAGFASAAEAADRFGWTYSTYVGHENGSRGIKNDMLRRYAAAFRVSVTWLIEGQKPSSVAERPRGRHLSQDRHGLAEPHLVPYSTVSGTVRPIIETTIRELAPDWKHLTTWQSARNWHPYAILRGDIIVIGTAPEENDGDLVVATWGDPHSITTLAQRAGDRVILPIGEELITSEPAISGTVAVVIRLPITARHDGQHISQPR